MIKKTENDIKKMWNCIYDDVPLVSIKCLTYNHELYLEKCLDGFLMQNTNFPFEIIIHDDASTDNTVKIIKEYANKFPSIIKPIYEEDNQYRNNLGLYTEKVDRIVKGKYIALCEGDDYWTDKNKLQIQVDLLENNPNCSIAYHRCVFVDDCENPTGYVAPPKHIMQINNKIFGIKDFMEIEFNKGYWCFHTTSFVFRSSIMPIYNDYVKNELKDFPYMDMPTQFVCLLNGNGIFIDKEMSCHRVNSIGSYTSKVNSNNEIAIKKEEKLINALLSFNQLTNSKYDKYINKRIYRAKLFILGLKNDTHEYCKEAIKINYWPILGIKREFELLLVLLFPRVYRKYNEYKQTKNH